MDSFDDALNAGQRMSSVQIAQFTKTLAQAGDLPNLLRLSRTIHGQDYDRDDYEDFVQSLLNNDFAEMAAGCLTTGVIRTWCEDNAFFIVQSCPAIFQRWGAPTPYFVFALGQAYEDLDSHEKIALLRGQPSNPQEQALHAFLQQNPRLWENLSPVWLGHASSPLRAAAVELGWTMDVLPDMVQQHARRDTIGHWVQAFEYAYSMAVATTLWSQHTEPGIAGKILGPLHAVAHANPMDIALAQAMLERSGCAGVLFAHTDTVNVASHERVRLSGLVDMYVTLGCQQLLIEALMHGTIPSFAPTQLQNMDICALPDLEGPR